MGVFADGAQRIIVASPSRWDSPFDTQQAVLQIRSVYDALYCCFLRAFATGLNAYWNKCPEKQKQKAKGENQLLNGSTQSSLQRKLLRKQSMEDFNMRKVNWKLLKLQQKML